MNLFRANCFILCLLLFVFIIGGMYQPVLAKSEVDTALTTVEPGQSQPPDNRETIKLEAKFPILRGNSASTYIFDVNINYIGKEACEIKLSTTTPDGFLVSIHPSSSETQEISSIFLEPVLESTPSTQLINVSVSPTFSSYTEKLPAPGEYVVTLTASTLDGKVTASVDLKFVITGKYEIEVKTAGALEGRLNAQLTAGKDNHITMVVVNTGTAPVEKVTFSSDKPTGWDVTFEPDEIDSIAPGASREVDVNIKPPGKAVAGDYETTLTVNTKDNLAKGELNIRVTVLKSTIWGWIGVGIVLLVVAGLAGIFKRFGRR